MKAKWGAAAACLAAVAALLWTSVPLWAGPALSQGPGLPGAQDLPPVPYRPARDDSIVVFGAHPDDETLGAGGFIAAATAAGARVTIVTFTNGDGYIEGVGVGYHTLFSTPARFIEYGKARQQEALAAAARLGVPAARVVFLGYPDRGLAVLWGRAWTCGRPYMSPYTRRTRSPYPLTYHPGAPYCGQSVLQDIEALLQREQPTVVVVHHPADTHRDHWAAEAFVASALEHLTLEGVPWATTVRLLYYLVHHGGWPHPQTYAPDLSLRPPAALRTPYAGWVQYPLRQSEEDAKLQAVLEYRTQVRLLRTYLLSFVRRNELFDLETSVQPPWVGEAGLPLTSPELWDRLPPAIQAPGPRSFLQAAQGSAVLESVAVAQAPDRLFVGIRLRKPAIREVKYRLELRLFYRGGRTGRLLLRFQVPKTLSAEVLRPEDLRLPPDAAGRSFGRRIEVALPLAHLGYPDSVLLGVATSSPLRTPVDRTPWTMVRLNPPGSGASRPWRSAEGRPGR